MNAPACAPPLPVPSDSAAHPRVRLAWKDSPFVLCHVPASADAAA